MIQLNDGHFCKPMLLFDVVGFNSRVHSLQ